MRTLRTLKSMAIRLFVISTLVLASCFHQDDISHESIYKNDILSYLTKLNHSVTMSGARKAPSNSIKELTNSIDFTQIEIYKLQTTEWAIIADLKPMASLGNTTAMKAIFFLNQNEIVRSTIVAFNDKTPADYNQVLISLLYGNRKGNTYSGEISFYGPLQNLILFDKFENGKLKENGVVHKKRTKNNTERVEACDDWYLITTIYYSDGTTSTSQSYLGTTCDGPCEVNNRMGRVE